MFLDEKRRTKIYNRWKQATKGPWIFHQPSAGSMYEILERKRLGSVVTQFEAPCFGEGGIPRAEDALFIAHAWQDTSDLLETIDTLLDERQACKGKNP